MAVATLTTFPGASIQQYDDGIKAMGLSAGGKHPAALFHWVAETDSGIQVTDVWASREEFEQFLQDQVMPISEQTGLPEPEIEYIDVHAYMTSA